MSNIYSLSQRWSPATSLDEENRLCRPHFQVIMNETSGDLVAVNVSRHRFGAVSLADWALEQPLPGYGELWVDKPEWLPILSRAFPSLEVSLGPKAPWMESYFQNLEETSRERLTSDDYCLVDLCGERAALRFYTAAWNYLEDHPLRVPLPVHNLEYSDRRGVTYKLVYDAGGKPGLAFLGSDELPTVGVGFDTPAFLAATDLELLERNKLLFGPDDYPWILFRALPQGLTRKWVEELTWLLESLPDFVNKTGTETKRRHLRWKSDPFRSKDLHKVGVSLQTRALDQIYAVGHCRKDGGQAFGDGGWLSGEVYDETLGSDSGSLSGEDCGWDGLEGDLTHEFTEAGEHFSADRFGGFGSDIAYGRPGTSRGHHQAAMGNVTQFPQRRRD